MGIWPWQCTPTGLDNSTELWMEKIHQAVTEIWVPQVWQPPARPAGRPPARTVTTIPLQPGGLRGNKTVTACTLKISWILHSKVLHSIIHHERIKHVRSNHYPPWRYAECVYILSQCTQQYNILYYTHTHDTGVQLHIKGIQEAFLQVHCTDQTTVLAAVAHPQHTCNEVVVLWHIFILLNTVKSCCKTVIFFQNIYNRCPIAWPYALDLLMPSYVQYCISPISHYSPRDMP